MSRKSRKKRRTSARAFWLILIVLAVIFGVVFFCMPIFPMTWKLIAAGILFLVVLLTGALSIHFYRSFFVKLLDVLLCLVLAFSSVALPYVIGRVSSLFDDLTTTYNTVTLYTLNSTYRSEHPELGLITDVSEDLAHYTSAVFLTCTASDEENQTDAMEQVRSVVGDVETIDCDSAITEAYDLYNGVGHVMLLSGSMLSMVLENYPEFTNDTVAIQTYSYEAENVVDGDEDLTSQAFTIFFGGNDEEGDLTTTGRTDVNMMVSVNPQTYQIAIISMPRDSYVPNPYLDNEYDKLTHLGMYGMDNTLQGLTDYMGLSSDVLDNYVIVNFTTFRNIIDAIGGVDVENDVAFTAINGMEYPEGTIHLSGEYALMYVRERKAFENGDFERNYHQQLVMEAIIDKLTSSALITNFNDLMDGLSGTFLTNLSSDALFGLVSYQLAHNASWNIIRYQVTGEVGEGECASSPGYYLSVVYPYENQVEFVTGVINDLYNGETLTQEDIPEGISSYSSYGY
jgi:LCP family protein required for cell wall assembly